MSLEDLVEDRDKAKALAHQIIDKPHYLALFLRFCFRPCCPRELVRTQVIYSKLKYISRPTVFAVLKKFRQLNIVEPMKVSLDKRKKYYKLTDLGKQVKSEITSMITTWLEHEMALSFGTVEELQTKIEKTLKVPAEYVIAVLDTDFLRKIIRAR